MVVARSNWKNVKRDNFFRHFTTYGRMALGTDGLCCAFQLSDFWYYNGEHTRWPVHLKTVLHTLHKEQFLALVEYMLYAASKDESA